MTWKLSFLATSNGAPLTKHYALRNGVLEKSSYPNIGHFDSHTEEVQSLPDLHRAITEHAALGHCLLKGELQRPLRHEPRRESTDKGSPTNWVCLDFDGVPGVTSFEELIPHLPSHFKNTSYIEQYSASQGIEPDKGYSAHVFMLLEGTALPSQLKEWLTHLNLSTPILRSAIHLNKASTTLRWPLDITTCQNDKLLYIAPPTLEGLTDPLGDERIRYVRRAVATLPIDLNHVDATHNAAKRQELLDKLRSAAKLPVRTYKLLPHRSGGTYLETSQVVDITSSKRERGYVYVNINGGDSWGYWHPELEPEILYNFKGEPNYLLKTFAPAHYKDACELATTLKKTHKDAEREAKKQTKREEKADQIERAEERAHETGLHYIAINDPRTDTYYKGTYDANTETLELFPTRSRSKLDDFLRQHKQPVREFIEDWSVEYNFDSDTIFDPDKRTINLYRRTEYLRKPIPSKGVPPTIAKLIDHMLGNDQGCVERFLNWLACIVQHRKLTMSAWVTSGIEGTGKGVLFHRILSPLLGKNHTMAVKIADFQSDFNEFMENCQLIMIDESQSSDLRDRDKVMQALKSLVSEETITVHRKHCNRYKADNRANFIVASNKHDPIKVDRSNRRFNIAPRQEHPLIKTKLIDGIMTSEEIDEGLGRELYAFAGYLLNRQADRELLLSPVQTEAQERLKELSSTTGETIAYNLQNGNLAYFVENWPDDSNPTRFRLATGVNNALNYEQLLDEFFANVGKRTNVPIKMAHALFYYITGMEQHPAKFIDYTRHLGLNPKKINYKGTSPRGLYGITWHATPELIAEWQQERVLRAQPQPVPTRRLKAI